MTNIYNYDIILTSKIKQLILEICTLEVNVLNKKNKEHGFNEVFYLGVKDKYKGKADVIILVWHDNQILPAEQYRKAHYSGKVADIAVCEDPNVQKEQIGENAIIYHFSGDSSGGG